MAIDIHALWDFADPAASERRFRDALAGASADGRLILQTQIARSHGLRRDFDQAREILAEVRTHLETASAEVRARYLLELGRSHVSATHPAELLTVDNRERARQLVMQAFTVAEQARLDALAVDALHMMAFVDIDPEKQLEWNRKAVACMERSEQPEARRWEGSLRNNLGYALHLKGDYDGALTQFELSRAAHQNAGRLRAVRIADWMMAWTFRAQTKFDEALAIQLRLENEWDADRQPDPYVFEELELIYRALGDDTRAAHYHERLKNARQ